MLTLPVAPYLTAVDDQDESSSPTKAESYDDDGDFQMQDHDNEDLISEDEEDEEDEEDKQDKQDKQDKGGKKANGALSFETVPDARCPRPLYCRCHVCYCLVEFATYH